MRADKRLQGEVAVTYSKYSSSAMSIVVLFPVLVLLPMTLSAQIGQESVVPLKNWATPLYWHQNQAEKDDITKPVPLGGGSPPMKVSLQDLTFVAMTPCRLVDTRGIAAGFNGITPFNGPSIAGATAVTFPLQSGAEATDNTEPAPCGVIPVNAEAYSFNIAVVPQAAGQVLYVTLWPAGLAQPVVATLNDRQGLVVSAAAIVGAGTAGAISLYNSGPAAIDVVIDMNGYFAAPSDLDGNTALGVETLGADTTGADNTAIGSAALASNTAGNANTASGYNSLSNNTTGNVNTAIGESALAANTTGNRNTASGGSALQENTTGSDNTASGYSALLNNSTGINNTAGGSSALLSNSTGNDNTASGASALLSNSTGNDNTANGYQALSLNSTGLDNTASGSSALEANTAGAFNMASGFQALQNNTTGDGNLASGAQALQANTIGSNNTADGAAALYNNATGNSNVGIGYQAGINAPTTNGNSIYIGSPGSGSDASGTIQIGSGTATSFFAAGISGVTTGVGDAVAVVIDSNGQLGTVVSSERFKEDIQDMGDASNDLLSLRPVTFRYKQAYRDGSKPLDYGLIAEEVAEIYPDLVVKDKDGQIQTVQYQKLTPMLLNEVQKQAEQNRQQAEQIHALEERLRAIEALLAPAPELVPR